MQRTRTLAALVLLAACSSKPENKTPPTPATAPAPAKEPLASAPASVPAPASAPAPAPTAILFAADQEFLVPLGCFDSTTKALVALPEEKPGVENPCLALLPAGARVKHSDGKPYPTKGGATWKCEPADFERKAAVIDLPSASTLSWNEVAVWPETTPIRFFPKGGNVDREAPANLAPFSAEEESLVLAAVKRAKPDFTGKLYAFQNLALDQDGDGKEDRFYSVFSPGNDPDNPFNYAFTGIFVAYGAAPSELIPLETGSMDLYEITAALDLDQDGKQEIVLHSFFYEGASLSLLKLKGKTHEGLGYNGCGA